jgi:membrane fusion protein (multidrug efflux system)
VLALIGLLLVAGAFSAGCGRGQSEGAAAADGSDSTAVDVDGPDEDSEEETTAVPVEVTVIQRGPIESILRSTATLEAESQTMVAAEAARRVVEIRVEEGSEVDQGQLLLRLQDAEQESALSKARTLLDQSQREWDRQQRLYEQQLTTEKAYNDALAAYEQRKLEAADAERELSYTRVRAPIPGTITRRLVKLGDQVSPGTQLFEIVDFSSLVALVYVPEKDLGELEVGQPARVTAPAIRMDPFPAKVLRVAPIVDARTGTVKVTVDVGGQAGLRPGLYVDVALVTDVRPDALLVPKRALLYENDQVFAYRLGEERKVERLRLIPALSDKDHIVPLEGIAEGDSLVTAGQAGLKDGALVKVVARETFDGAES